MLRWSHANSLNRHSWRPKPILTTQKAMAATTVEKTPLLYSGAGSAEHSNLLLCTTPNPPSQALHVRWDAVPSRQTLPGPDLGVKPCHQDPSGKMTSRSFFHLRGR